MKQQIKRQWNKITALREFPTAFYGICSLHSFEIETFRLFFLLQMFLILYNLLWLSSVSVGKFKFIHFNLSLFENHNEMIEYWPLFDCYWSWVENIVLTTNITWSKWKGCNLIRSLKLFSFWIAWHIIGPSQRNVPVQIQKSTNGVVACFTVVTVGEHSIDVQVKNQRLPGAPFRYN